MRTNNQAARTMNATVCSEGEMKPKKDGRGRFCFSGAGLIFVDSVADRGLLTFTEYEQGGKPHRSNRIHLGK